jgi:vanillate/3-O-methylgallate O-demethylase
MTSEFLKRQREGWAAAAGPVDQATKPIFSPAAVAQARGNMTSTMFKWSAIYLPLEYTNWLEEAQSYTTTSYIGDWSSIDKVVIRGPQALEFLSWVGINALANFEMGQIKHHVHVDEQGKVAAEGVLFRTGTEEFVFTGGNGDWMLYQFGQRRWDACIEDASPDLFIFEVQGPTSFHVMQKVTGEALGDLGFNRTRTSSIGGTEVRILRTGITGELGYEIHGPAEHASDIWSAVVECGKDFGIRQIGLRAQIISHIEAGIATNGLDYLSSAIGTPGQAKIAIPSNPSGSFIPYNGIADLLRTPAELGWGGRGRFDHDFLGRGALEREFGQGGPVRTLVGLEWDPQDVLQVFADLFEAGFPMVTPMELPRAFGSYDQVLEGDGLVGISSSRVYSVHLRRMISLAVIDRKLTEPGTRLDVLWGNPGSRQRRIRVTVRKLPLKPDRRRTDVTTL